MTNSQSLKFSIFLSITLSTLLLAACGGGNVDANASNVSINIPKSSVIASSKASSKASSASSARSSIPAGAVVSDATKISHNPGQNCMNCHLPGGTGASVAVFTFAGTGYKGGSAFTGGHAVAYVHNTNQISVDLIIDKTGNFYTTLPVSGTTTGNQLVTGVDVQVGTTKMSGVVSNGSCNACHGNDRGIISGN